MTANTAPITERRERTFLVLAGIFLSAMTLLNVVGITRFIQFGPLALAVVCMWTMFALRAAAQLAGAVGTAVAPRSRDSGGGEDTKRVLLSETAARRVCALRRLLLGRLTRIPHRARNSFELLLLRLLGLWTLTLDRGTAILAQLVVA